MYVFFSFFNNNCLMAHGYYENMGYVLAVNFN